MRQLQRMGGGDTGEGDDHGRRGSSHRHGQQLLASARPGDSPALTYNITGLVNGDTAASVTTGAPVLSTTATSASPTGQYAITITQGTLTATTSNYALTASSFVNGTFTITAGLSQTITFRRFPMPAAWSTGLRPLLCTPPPARPDCRWPITVQGPATITGSILSITGAGPVAVTATQPGDATLSGSAAGDAILPSRAGAAHLHRQQPDHGAGFDDAGAYLYSRRASQRRRCRKRSERLSSACYGRRFPHRPWARTQSPLHRDRQLSPQITP